MTDFKLSICIATFNRAGFIAETLDSIVSQSTDEVEIVVLDGGSTDKTTEVVKTYQKTVPNIQYIRQETKGGVDKDYCKAVDISNGEYCWLMSDDDLLKPGAVKAVLSELNRNYSLIIVNGEVRNSDLSKILEQKRLPLDTDRIYKSYDHTSLLIDTLNYLTFIGCVIIKRSCWSEREKEKYFGSCFIHIGVIFQNHLPSDTLVISKPFIIIRYGNAQWSDKAFEIWMFKLPDLIWGFSNFTESIKRQACLKNPWRRINELVKLRAKGAYTHKEYKKWLKPRISSRLYKFEARFISHFSGVVVNTLAIVYTNLFYPKANAMLLDFKISRFYWRNMLKKILTNTKQGM